MVVVASDGGFPKALSSSTSVLVSVADVNDNPPKFQHHPYVTHIPSPTTSGKLLKGSAAVALTNTDMQIDGKSFHKNMFKKYFPVTILQHLSSC